MKQLMVDNNTAASHSFLLDDDSSIPFSLDDIAALMEDKARLRLLVPLTSHVPYLLIGAQALTIVFRPVWPMMTGRHNVQERHSRA